MAEPTKPLLAAAILDFHFDTERIVYLLREATYVKPGFTSFFVICFIQRMQVIPGFVHRIEAAKANAGPMI